MTLAENLIVYIIRGNKTMTSSNNQLKMLNFMMIPYVSASIYLFVLETKLNSQLKVFLLPKEKRVTHCESRNAVFVLFRKNITVHQVIYQQKILEYSISYWFTWRDAHISSLIRYRTPITEHCNVATIK